MKIAHIKSDLLWMLIMTSMTGTATASPLHAATSSRTGPYRPQGTQPDFDRLAKKEYGFPSSNSVTRTTSAIAPVPTAIRATTGALVLAPTTAPSSVPYLASVLATATSSSLHRVPIATPGAVSTMYGPTGLLSHSVAFTEHATANETIVYVTIVRRPIEASMGSSPEMMRKTIFMPAYTIADPTASMRSVSIHASADMRPSPGVSRVLIQAKETSTLNNGLPTRTTIRTHP